MPDAELQLSVDGKRAQCILSQILGFPGAHLLMKPATTRTMHLFEVLAWALLAFAGASAMRAYRPMPLGNDSYQYLNVAEHYRHEHQLTTSLVHFDTERSHGRIPAPLTSFPVGYPWLVGTLSFSGDLEATARLLSSVCYAGTAALLAWGLILAGVTGFGRQLALVLFVTNALAAGFATEALTEPLYGLLSTGAVVGLLWAEAGEPAKQAVMARAAGAFLLAGLAVWVRYAGLFLIAALVGYAVLRLLLPGSRFRILFLVAALIPMALAAGLLTRNVVTVGTWRGGNEMRVHTPLKVVAVDYIRAQMHLMLGEHAVRFGVWEGVFLAGALVVTFLLATAARKGVAPKGGLRVGTGAWLVGLTVVIYSAGVFYAGMRTVISFGERMFLPMLPLYLLLAGMAANWVASHWRVRARRGWLEAGLLLVTVGYIGINARDLYEPSRLARHKILAAEYAEPTAGGQSLFEWVNTHVPAGDTIFAANGQATGYLLHRPTVSMIEAHYSPVRWECGEVRKQMQRFGASYVFLYKPSSTTSEQDLLAESKFVAASVTGLPSCGFAIAAENADIRILRREARD
jgi:hypothetical protein